MGCFLEEFEDGIGTITDVEFIETTGPSGPIVDIEVVTAPSTDDGRTELTPSEASIDPEGRFRIALETADPLVPPGTEAIDVTPTRTTLDDDGTITVSLRATVGSDEDDDQNPDSIGASDRDASAVADAEAADESDGAESSAVSDADTTEGEERSVPAFRDPERLAEVYESCDTFAEMSEAIDMDVTGETVRRYMIDYGIHEPNSYRTAGDETEESAADDALADATPEETTATLDDDQRIAVTDGIGIHEDVTVDTLVESISRANTVYEVQQDIGLDREETREMLRRLDLLDLVVGRIATEHERNIGRETILERLRRVAETGAQGSAAT